MKKRFSIILSAILLVSSCSSSAPLDWGFAINEGCPTFDRNGDILYLNEEADNYDISFFTKTFDSKEIISRINAKEDTFLLLSSPSCSHCQELEPKLRQFLKDSTTEVIRLKIEATLESYHNLLSTYPNFVDVLKDSTPTIYFLSPTEGGCDIQAIDFYDDDDSSEKLENFFYPLYSRSNIYHFTNFAKYESFVNENECLSYVLDDESINTYSDEIASYAKNSPKYTAILEKEYFSESDLKKLDARFSSNTMALDNKNGPSFLATVQEALSYYEA